MNEEAPLASQFASPAKLTGDPLAWNVKGVNGDKAEAQEKQRQMNENDMDCICQRLQMYTTCVSTSPKSIPKTSGKPRVKIVSANFDWSKIYKKFESTNQKSLLLAPGRFVPGQRVK